MWQTQVAGYGRDSRPIESYERAHMSTAGVDQQAAGVDEGGCIDPPAQDNMQPEGQTAFSWGLQVGLPIDSVI